MTEKSIAQIDPQDAAIAAEAATKGDLAALSAEGRTALYGATCRSMGLNPLSQPFQYIKLNGRLTLYATRTATDQLRKINGVSITKVEKEVFDDVLTVTVHATDASGRSDMEIGAVMIGGLRGEALANAHMKAITKAKRRVTLSISGLGWLDETEISSVPTAQAVVVDQQTGEIGEPPLTQVTARNEAPGDSINTTAMRRLHAVAKKHDITHDDLHAWALGRGSASLRDVTDEELNGLSDALNMDGMADKFRAKYQPSEIEGLDELNAQLDREQVAARARS